MATQTSSVHIKGARYQKTITSNNHVTESVSVQPREDTNWSRTSNTTPGFHKPGIRTRPLRPNAFSYSKHTYQYMSGYDFRRDNTHKVTDVSFNSSYTSGDFGTPVGPPPGVTGWGLARDSSVVSALAGRANNKLLSKVKNSSFNAPLVFAERAKTAELIAHSAMQIVSSIRHLRRGDFISAAKALGVKPAKRAHSRFKQSFRDDSLAQATANGWLGLQYGWKPLLTDIYGATETLAKSAARYTATSSSVSVKQKEKYKKSTVDKSDGTWTNNYLLTRHYTVRVGVIYSKSNAAVASMKELGITNPASVAWELVPFSFVVDWFLPIGAYIDTWDATLGLTFESGYQTVFYSGYLEQVTDCFSQGRYGQFINVMKSGSETQINCDRTVLGSFPSPSIPRFKNPASVLHMSNALALLSSIFRK